MTSVRHALMLVAACLFAMPSKAWTPAGPGVAEAARDPRVAAVLAEVDRLDAALVSGDIAAFADAMAGDLVVNTPQNRIGSRDRVVERNAAGAISYASYERLVEHAAPRGDMVLLMGEERVVPKGAAPHAGKAVVRRFTDLWKQDGGRWRLTARQATIISVGEPPQPR